MTDLSGNNSETINIRYNNNYIQYSKNNVTWINITAFPITITNNTPTDYLTVILLVLFLIYLVVFLEGMLVIMVGQQMQ